MARKVTISVRIPQDLLDELDEEVNRGRSWANRSHYIECLIANALGFDDDDDDDDEGPEDEGD